MISIFHISMERTKTEQSWSNISNTKIGTRVLTPVTNHNQRCKKYSGHIVPFSRAVSCLFWAKVLVSPPVPKLTSKVKYSNKGAVITKSTLIESLLSYSKYDYALGKKSARQGLKPAMHVIRQWSKETTLVYAISNKHRDWPWHLTVKWKHDIKLNRNIDHNSARTCTYKSLCKIVGLPL